MKYLCADSLLSRKISNSDNNSSNAKVAAMRRRAREIISLCLQLNANLLFYSLAAVAKAAPSHFSALGTLFITAGRMTLLLVF